MDLSCFPCAASCFWLNSRHPMAVSPILGLTTSVRATKGSNAFVAASSGVLHWRALWRMRPEEARGKATSEKWGLATTNHTNHTNKKGSLLGFVAFVPFVVKLLSVASP